MLDVAERLAQPGSTGSATPTSLAELRITKASFTTVPDQTGLGCALSSGTVSGFVPRRQISATGRPASRQLEQYVQLYAGVLRSDRLCLCGMLAAEYSTLAEPMKRAIRGFFDENEAWLARLLESGRQADELNFEGAADEAANAFTSTLEGAMLLARSYGDAARFETTAARLLREYASASRDGHTPGRSTVRSRGAGGRRG